MLPSLELNDKIYICAPAKAIDQESIHFAQTFFETSGYKVELSQNLLGRYNYFSGSELERLDDLQRGLDHSDAKAILCARGGYGCIQLLEKLNWTTFKRKPKWIIGFSDITVLHLALNKMGIPSLHATMPLNFKKNTSASLSTMLSALKHESFSVFAPVSKYNKMGEVKGEVIGGNLTIIHAMLTFVGVDFFTNKILFIEDIGEHLYQIDRMFFGLKFIGALEKISGLIVGGFTNVSDTGEPFGKRVEEIVNSHLKHREIPIGFNFPFGHLDNNQAILLGKDTQFTVNQKGSMLRVFTPPYLESI